MGAQASKRERKGNTEAGKERINKIEQDVRCVKAKATATDKNGDFKNTKERIKSSDLTTRRRRRKEFSLEYGQLQHNIECTCR